MSTPVNYYVGVPRGAPTMAKIVVGAVSAATTVDVEIRMQINNGTAATGLTRDDVIMSLRVLEDFLLSNGIPQGTPGNDLPAP